MKNNKTIIIFLLKFFGVYLLLFVVYSFYFSENLLECSYVTTLVAEQSNTLISYLGYNSSLEVLNNKPVIYLLIDTNPVSSVIEGCNAISIIILFISFIIAFSSTFKRTVLYVITGSLLIHFFNVLRIALITIALYEYPTYKVFFHDVLFPIVIYGFTFLLWVFWVQYFRKINEC